MEIKTQIRAIVLIFKNNIIIKIDDEIILLESMKNGNTNFLHLKWNEFLSNLSVSEGDEIDEGQIVAIIE